MNDTTDKKERGNYQEVIMKIKQKIELTEQNLKEIEAALKQKIEKLGSAEAGKISGYSRQYMNDVINRESQSLSYSQVLKLAKKLLI